MEPKIYSLLSNSERAFYSNLSNYTDKILCEASFFLKRDIEAFNAYIKQNTNILERTQNEYIVELIILGTLFKQYAAYATHSKSIGIMAMNSLYKLRSNSMVLKPHADTLRGLLVAPLLYNMAAQKPKNNISTLNKLILWLQATGEFTEECKRILQWKNYLMSISATESENSLTRAVSFAGYFEEEAKKALGKYTQGVNSFLISKHKTYKKREDFIFTGRKEVEYHLNMFGAEVLNRELRYNFEKARYKILLVPTCMSRPNNGMCKRKPEGPGLKCVSCSINCQVSLLNKKMVDSGGEVYLIPHSTSYSHFLKYWKNQNEIALIGVACVLNLITGGYEMQSLNIPSQCVILDYPGCKKHWHNEGLPTTINTHQLDFILKNKTQALFNKSINFVQAEIA